MEHPAANGVTPDPLKEHIIVTLGIEDRAAWEKMTAQQMLTSLRENAELTLEAMGEKLGGLNSSKVWQLEHSRKQEHADTLLSKLKPLLDDLKLKGWLNPKSLTADPGFIKEKIITLLGIKDHAPWEGKAIPEILATLRENAGLKQNELGELLGEAQLGWRFEHSGKPQHVKAILETLQPWLDDLKREGWLDPRSLMPIEPEQLKKKMCALLGIAYCAPWEATTVPQMLTGLRENAGLTLEEVGQKLELTRERIRQIEEVATMQDVKRLLPVLKPRFEENKKRFGELASACHTLRTAKGMSSRQFDNAMIKRELEKFDSAEFEKNPGTNKDGSPRSFASFLSIVDQLCQFYYCPTVQDLLEEAAFYAQKTEGKFTAALAAESSPESFKGR